MELQRDFKGVWIPKEVWLDDRLNALEKIILVEIDSLDCEETGCFASNDYIAEFCQCSLTKVSLSIKKLTDLGYVYVESFNGRTRILKSRLSKNERQTFKKCEADFQEIKENNIIDYNKEIKINDNNIKDNKKILKEKESVAISHNSQNPRVVESQEKGVCCSNDKGYVAETTKGESKNEIATKDNINYEEILNHWNSLGIIKHRQINIKTQKKIKELIKNDNLTLQDILDSMDRYNMVLKDESYFFDYKWTLEDFICREKGLPYFYENGMKWINYLESPSGKKAKEKFTMSQMDFSDYNN